MNLHILALETSSSLCDVALLSLIDGQISVHSTSHDATGEHAERLLPMVDQLLMQADIAREQLDAVAFGQGPGGFTGLRVACGVAQGMAFALDLPVIPIVSLLAVAELAASRQPVCVVLQDARMGEVYAAAYRQVPAGGRKATRWASLQDPILLSVNDVGYWINQQAPAWLDDNEIVVINVVGDGLAAYPKLAQSLSQSQPNGLERNESRSLAEIVMHIGPPLRADAESIARLALQAWHQGETVLPEHAAPLYVRDKVAYTTQERNQGFGGNPKAAAPVSIDIMTAADLDEVVAIESSVQQFPWTRGNFDDALQAGYGSWVVRQGSKIVGFCVLMFAPDVAHLLLIAVASDAQRAGLGYQLLRQCEREAAARSLPALILEVRPSNHNALAFYTNRGFKQLAVRKDYYPKDRDQREDAWVLEKRLDRPR